MPIKAVVSDWNGTLTTNRDEGSLWKHIGTSYLRDSLPFHPYTAAKLAAAFFRLSRLTDCYKRGEIPYSEIYDEFNRSVLHGMRLEKFEQYVQTYAALDSTQERLDTRALRPVLTAEVQKGILSTGYERVIGLILGADAKKFELGIKGNDVKVRHSKRKNKVDCFELKITGQTKSYHFAQMCWDVDINSCAYIGDSEEDFPTFEVAGYPVVALLAPDNVRQEAARHFRARTPTTEEELFKSITTA